MLRWRFMVTIVFGSLFCLAGCAFASSNRPPTPSPTPEIPITDTTQKDAAAKLFGGRDLFAKVPVHPLRLAGAIAWADPKADGTLDWQFTRLLPAQPLPEPEFEATIVFQTLVNRKFAVSVDYLALVSAQLGQEDLAEVIIEDVYRAIGPEYNTEEVQRALASFKAKHNKPGRTFFYVEAVRYTTMKYRTYQKIDASAKSGFFVNINGSYYHTNERFLLTQLVAIDKLQLEEMGTEKSLQEESWQPRFNATIRQVEPD